MQSTATRPPSKADPTFCEWQTGPKLPGILAHHVTELRSSGLSDETIAAAKIYSELSADKMQALLEWKRFPQKQLPAIVFPYVDDQGRNGYARVKCDRGRKDQNGKTIKYESPRGQPNQLYLPPGVAAVLSDASSELLLTEGEKKALAVNQAGFPCIGLVGVYGWKEKRRESMLPAMERIAWSGRSVFIVFDSDISEKPEVQDAEMRLGSILKSRGAIVKVVRVPSGPMGTDGKPIKQGIDDYLVTQAHPIKAMRDLMNAAQELEKPEAVEVKLEGRVLDATREGPQFVELTKLDGVARLMFHRGTFLYWKNGAYRERQPAEVRSELVKFLLPKFYRLKQSHTSDTLDVVKALSCLPSSIQAPAWIGGKSGPWPADEVLVAQNGIVHLPSLANGLDNYRAPLTPRLFTENALDYDCDIEAPQPTAWLEFLAQLWPDDPESISLLQEWFGYCLTADTRQQKIMMIVGPKRSGKGTIARIQRQLIGPENVAGSTLASLATNFGLWPLLGKSLDIISDARLSGRTDSQIVVERLLSISGEDALTIDRKNLEPVTAKLPTRMMILSNELPRLGDSSGALAGRMILLRLRESFYGREDHSLTDRLLAELPGILNWAIVGWCSLRGRGRFAQPASASDLLGELHDISSPMGEFVRDCCIVEIGRNVARSEIYARYREWCEAKGRNHPEDETGFGRNLRAAVTSLGDSQHRVNGSPVRFYEGIGLA